MAARVAEEEEKTASAASAAAAKAQRLYYPRTVRNHHYEPEFQQMVYAGDEDEGDGEFNADLVSNRRRGDKGVW